MKKLQGLDPFALETERAGGVQAGEEKAAWRAQSSFQYLNNAPGELEKDLG